MRRLTRFDIRLEDDGFVLTLVDDGGQTNELAASPEAMEQLIDSLDALLGEAAEDDEEEATYQKPLG